jgi:hypothetical protein
MFILVSQELSPELWRLPSGIDELHIYPVNFQLNAFKSPVKIV